jgi:hypothetical protein
MYYMTSSLIRVTRTKINNQSFLIQKNIRQKSSGRWSAVVMALTRAPNTMRRVNMTILTSMFTKLIGVPTKAIEIAWKDLNDWLLRSIDWSDWSVLYVAQVI